MRAHIIYARVSDPCTERTNIWCRGHLCCPVRADVPRFQSWRRFGDLFRADERCSNADLSRTSDHVATAPRAAESLPRRHTVTGRWDLRRSPGP